MLLEKSDENDDCFICIIDHGGFAIPKNTPRFKNGESNFKIFDCVLEKQEFIWGSELGDWLDYISYNVCTILISACFSGGFIRDISKENRIIMTTTKICPGVGSIWGDFTSFFFDKLVENVSYGKAWEYAEKKIRSVKIRDLPSEVTLLNKTKVKLGMLLQNPQIDDNGDGRSSGRRFIADRLPIWKDGHLALKTYPS